jgi:hypothetical protein
MGTVYVHPNWSAEDGGGGDGFVSTLIHLQRSHIWARSQSCEQQVLASSCLSVRVWAKFEDCSDLIGCLLRFAVVSVWVAGIAQSVQLLATGRKVRGSNSS